MTVTAFRSSSSWVILEGSWSSGPPIGRQWGGLDRSSSSREECTTRSRCGHHPMGGGLSPARYVGLIEELGGLIPTDGPPDQDALLALFKRYDSAIVG